MNACENIGCERSTIEIILIGDSSKWVGTKTFCERNNPPSLITHLVTTILQCSDHSVTREEMSTRLEYSSWSEDYFCRLFRFLWYAKRVPNFLETTVAVRPKHEHNDRRISMGMEYRKRQLKLHSELTYFLSGGYLTFWVWVGSRRCAILGYSNIIDFKVTDST